MQIVTAVTAAEGGGLCGDHGTSRKRGITFFASGAWAEVCREADVILPWHVRRANVLLEADELGHLVGQCIRIGDVLLQIHRETTPCSRMDEILPGLCDVLRDNCRGGVCGEVLHAGRLQVGDVVCRVD